MASEFVARMQAVITDVDGVTGGGTTSGYRSLINGTADPYATIDVYDGTSLLGVVSANGQGGWSLQLSAPLSDGIHDFSVVQAGDFGLKSTSSYFSISVIAPEEPQSPFDETILYSSASRSNDRVLDNATPYFPPNAFTSHRGRHQ
ncbi:hemolysin-type calcium-binding region [Caballeronia sordidicola]|uniref:Hemolysin-type calcium-binding region n=1 Tax=Caballeronia sordidicola TaxID=196367 RepID=A0A158GZM6_CABSO|nr:hypothetical protein [Caballeronia sordidicola]SAL37281.1 hemolysin-type calcium-binding region [Caballeronia sordidicola]